MQNRPNVLSKNNVRLNGRYLYREATKYLTHNPRDKLFTHNSCPGFRGNIPKDGVTRRKKINRVSWDPIVTVTFSSGAYTLITYRLFTLKYYNASMANHIVLLHIIIIIISRPVRFLLIYGIGFRTYSRIMAFEYIVL